MRSIGFFFILLALATILPAQYSGSGGGGGTWGSITGTLSDQTDLQTEVNTKMEEPAGNGIAVRTGNDTSINRTFTSSDGSLTVTNGDGVSGNIDAVVDTAVFSRYSSGTGDVPATGSVGTFYSETDALSFYTYPAVDTEHWLLSIPAGTTIGDFFYVSAVDVLTAINGTDGNLITWSADDVPALVVTGSAGNVLVSGGAGAAPTFTDMPYTSLADGTDGELITWDAAGAPAAVAAGTSGQVLTSNGAGAAPTFQAAAGGSSFDPSTTLFQIEEFTAGHTSIGNVGTHGLYPTLIGSGTNAYTICTAIHNGLWRMSSHATNDDSGATIGWVSASGANSEVNNWEAANWTIEALVLLGSNSTAITNSVVIFGLTTSQGAFYHSNMLAIRRDTDLGDTAFEFITCDTGACVTADDAANVQVNVSTITPTAGNYYRLRIRHAVSGVGGNPTVYMKVNDESELTFCSSGCDDTLETYEAVTMVPFFAYGTRTTTGVISSDLDYISVSISGLTRY